MAVEIDKFNFDPEFLKKEVQRRKGQASKARW